MTEQPSAPEQDRGGRAGVIPIVLVLGLVLILALFIVGITSNSRAPAPPPSGPAAAIPQAEAPKPPSPWRVSTTPNELTGETQITAATGFGDEAIIIRQRQNKLDCYVTTGEFLETVENMDSRRSIVKYKFDDGPIVRQSWTISDDNTALFYPGNPRPFLQKMRAAKRFVIEYKPSDKVPQTESFDVSSFPPELADILGRSH